MVALARTNLGSPPCRAATRRNLLSTTATCEPKTPRRTCASSTATIRRFRKKSAQASWFGSTPMFSMSGLVRTMLALRRTSDRIACGVSPS
jgi:hypothetical protein